MESESMIRYWNKRQIHLMNVVYMNGGATKCYVFSAAPNPDGMHRKPPSNKVGSVVFVTGENISMAFTTGSPLFEDNFDYDLGHFQPIPVENCVFGALKLMIEIYSVQTKVDDDGSNATHVGLLRDNFMSIDNAVKKGVENGEFPASGDPLVDYVLQRRLKMEMLLDEREKHDFKWFKQMFLDTRRELLAYLPRTVPKVAKMAVGRSVIYKEFVEHIFDHEDYGTWAVYLLRCHILNNAKKSCTVRERGVYPLLWHMLHFFGNQQEWSKTDSIWAILNDKVPEPTKLNGPLCYFKREYDDSQEARVVRKKILENTVFDNSATAEPRLGRANTLATQRFALDIGIPPTASKLNDSFLKTESEVVDILTNKIPWLPWIQSTFSCEGDQSTLQMFELQRQICNATPAHTINLLEEIETRSSYAALKP